MEDLKKAAVNEGRRKKSSIRIGMDEQDRALAKREADDGGSLSKSIINMLNGPNSSVERLAFEVDPSLNNQYSGLYKLKLRLLPDTLLKRISIQDDLVASIVQVRGNQVSAHGRPQHDRHATGYDIAPNPGVVERMSPDQKKALDERIARAVSLIATCGHDKGWSEEEKCTFATWLKMSARDAVVVGRIATEIIYAKDALGNDTDEFHSFRAIDAGTIFRATHQKEAIEQVRAQARRLLESINNKRLVPEKFENDEYPWVQVIDGNPKQGFTAKECVVHNFYPVSDVDLNGYPVTPIDTMLSAVTTHINITTHNKMYFQTGRATRGMLVIKSDDVDEKTIGNIKQQFNASINNVSNSWRMPVFGIGANDEITWSAIDGGGKDMEFQYLMDQNARVIFSAFQMSPEEVSGWSYLSRGTNNQALSESNNEYKLQAARDVGIRPLLLQFEDFLNAVILPLIDAELAKICRLRLVGLDADTPEKESVRLQQDAPLHMTMDQILERVEKKPIGREFGGEFLLNPQFHEILDQHFTVGEIEEKFMDRKGASKDPTLAYRRDPFWFQWQQFMAEQKQQQQQMQAQQQQAQQSADGERSANPGASETKPAGVTDEASPDQSQSMDAETNKAKSDKAKIASGSDTATPINTADTGEDLTRSVDMAINVLTKGEDQLPPSKRRILAQHRMVIKQAMDGWQSELREATKEIVAVADKHTNKHRKN